MTDATYIPGHPPLWAARTSLVLRVLLAIAFLAAGGAKLAGVPAMVQVFEAIGIGQWFRLVTGTVEITGAIMLIVPMSVGFGAALLAATMACAVLTHLSRIGGNSAPAIVLMLLSVFVLWVSRSDLTRILARSRKAMP